MYVRMVTIEVVPSKIDEFLSIYRAEQVPALQAAQGFHEAQVLTDAHTGKVIGLTVWETEADAKAAPARNAKYGDLIVKAGALEYYELSVQV